MPNFRTIDITPNTSYDNDYAQNNWFNYADSKKLWMHLSLLGNLKQRQYLV